MADATGFVRLSAALHAAGAAVCLVAPRAWPYVVATIVPDHLLLAWGSLWPKSTLVGPNMTSLPGGSAAQRAVALTFDDGPDPRTTPRVLDLLDRHRARATFFCVGRKAERHPDLVREIARRGHRVENHSWGHAGMFCCFSPDAQGRDIDRAQATLARLAGATPRYFRAPAGLRSPWLDGVLRSRNLTLVSWTRRGLDALSKNPGPVVRRLTQGLAAGDILVLHDGGGGAGPEALPRLLEALDAARLRSVPLPDPVPAGAAGAAA